MRASSRITCLAQLARRLDQRADAAVDGGLHQAAHLQQLGLQFVEFFGEMDAMVISCIPFGLIYPNRPVM